MRKITLACLFCLSSLTLTSCFSFLDNSESSNESLPGIGEWAEAGNYKFRVISVENTKKIQASYSEYTTQNNFMCILVELKNDSNYTHYFSYSDFDVYKGQTKYSSKGSEAYYYAQSKGEYPSLYLSGSIDASLSGKYYLVYETPTTNLDDEYELEYYYLDKARVKLSGGDEGSSSVTPSGEVTFEQFESLASKVPVHSYVRASISGTAVSYVDGQRQSQSYSETWAYSNGSWSLTYYYPAPGGIELDNLELNYVIDYLSSDQKEKCVTSVDPFKIVATGMRSAMISTALENSTYIWNKYGLIESVNMDLYSSSSSSIQASWSMTATYYTY